MNQEELDPHRHLVLVIEDDQDLRDIVSEVLGAHGYRTESAIDGQDALAKLGNSHKPCVILLDLMMPVMDGWTFRERQLADPALRDIPVIILTAHASSSQIDPELAPSGFLAKPVSLKSLLGMVDRVCTAEHPSVT